MTITMKMRMVRNMPTIEAEAIKCGRFAVHTSDGSPLDLWPKDAWYVISHIATGYMVAFVEGRANARKCAAALSKAVGSKNFSESDFTLPWSDRYRTFVEQAKEIVKEHKGERE